MNNKKFTRFPTMTLALLGLFLLLTGLMTYPIPFRLADFTVYHLFTDDLLESWTLAWDVHALLGGPESLQNIWNANIFYPYPATLAFSEHLLAWAVLLMPAVLLGQSPLVATNLGLLLSTALTGWGMYLLIFWLTGNRWAGLVAGLAFAFAPYRLGHMTQLHLISTHWIPFILLAMARLIKHNRTPDLLLLTLFTNLQFFSVVNYAPLVALLTAVWALAFFYTYRRQLALSLFGRLALFAVVTLALNWPVLRLYQQVSEQMGVVRTLGDASVYGAYLINYILPMGNSLLYGRWLGLPTHIEYQFPGIGIFISTFPGVIPLLLSLAALAFSIRLKPLLRRVVWAALLIAIVGLLLSFGANQAAFGANLSASLGRLLPYPYLYEFAPVLQGLRVPIRFALLFTVGVSLMAGLGFAELSRRFWPAGRQAVLATVLVSGLIIVEHLPAPLPGVPVPPIGPERTWLANHTPPDAAIIELPYFLHTARSNEEVLREYESAAHFRWLVNGTSGFKPDWLRSLGVLLDTFPNWQAFDALRQLGVDYMVLHQDQYEPAAWENITALLPAYLPAIQGMHSVGGDLIVQLKPPACAVSAAEIQVDAAAWPRLAFTNGGAATWVGDPNQASRLQIGSEAHRFLEPLFVPPGETATLTLPAAGQSADWQVQLGNLGQTLQPGAAANPLSPLPPPDEAAWQPLEIGFVSGAVLQSMAIGDAPVPCSVLPLQLRWGFEVYAGESIQVELIDRFGRVTVSSQVTPVVDNQPVVTTHRLPLAETVPPGQYQLRVRLQSAAGEDIPAIGLEGVPITQPLALPLIVRPAQPTRPVAENSPILQLNNGVRLLGADGPPAVARPGDWLRFTLFWQSERPLETGYTVFTQLLGPDGQVRGQHDNPPGGGWYATPLWQPGDVVPDHYALRLDPAAPPGDYRLIVGMYDPATGQRVGVAGGADFIEIGQVVVGQPPN